MAKGNAVNIAAPLVAAFAALPVVGLAVVVGITAEGSHHPAEPVATATATASSTVLPQPSENTSGQVAAGMYSGPFSYSVFRSAIGKYPQVETSYLNADRVTTPNLRMHEAEIDLGISPVITLDYKNGPFTRAEIAAWGPKVQNYYATFVAGLRTLADYAASSANGTHVYFADEHEAQIKINQGKYTFSGYGDTETPNTADSAAAWNAVMRYVRKSAPGVVRVYWFGGSGANEHSYAALLDPRLIQMATFDPYRWRHNRATDTPQQLWGSTVSRLQAATWMHRRDGSLKPWGITEWGTDAVFGDAANATFVREAMQFFRDSGAAFEVYFNRVDGNDRTNNFVITDGSQPLTLAAYRAAVN